MSAHSARGTAAHTVLEECLSLSTIGIPTHPRQFLGHTIHVEPSTGHSARSPSGADRWASCAGSPTMEQKAREGGAVEEEIAYDITIDEEDVVAVTVAYDYVVERMKEPGVAAFFEKKVSPEKSLLTDDCRGTLDIFLKSGDLWETIDYKHGKGVYVPETTFQLELYMLGACDEHENNEIAPRGRLTVIQPRHPGTKPIRSVEIDNLPRWTAERGVFFRSAHDATMQENAPLVPSEKACRFCDAAGICKPGQEYALSKMGITQTMPTDGAKLYTKMERFAAVEPSVISGDQMAAVLAAKEILLGALSAMETSAIHMLRNRSAPVELREAFKVIRGNAHRKWRQEEEDTLRLAKKIRVEDPEKGKLRGLGKKDLTETRVKSPAAVERVLKLHGVTPADARWDALQRLIEHPEGALKLVPIDAPGESVDIGVPPPPPETSPEKEEAPNHGTLT